MLPIPNNAWHKPSRSAGANNCVEVAHTHGWTALRDSKNKTGPILIFTDDEWSTFIKDAVVSQPTRQPCHPQQSERP
jgi:hypothetical protein